MYNTNSSSDRFDFVNVYSSLDDAQFAANRIKSEYGQDSTWVVFDPVIERLSDGNFKLTVKMLKTDKNEMRPSPMHR